MTSGTEQTRHFDVVQSEEEDEDHQITTDEDPIESFDDQTLNQFHNDWLEFDNELRAFEVRHKEYVSKLDEVESLKTKYAVEFDKYKKKLDVLQKDFNKFKKSYMKNDAEEKKLKTSQSTIDLDKSNSSSNLTTVSSAPSFDRMNNTLSTLERLDLISEHLNTNALYLTRISTTVPRKDPYLKVILGAVDVSILNKADKWTYKQDYEKFKFIVTVISLVASVVIWSLPSQYRACDSLFHFLLVWYYCTLTIRESILVVNGSNINPWWRTHHFVATVATGILLTWPDSRSYHAFRTQFFVFSFYLSFVQVLQFYYQRGCLYRLRALGETHDMDITIEGFHRWMFRGLSFLVPFLLVGYLFQFYNASTLWQLAHLSTTHEWQVMVLAVIFFILFLGNILTTLSVLRDKAREKTSPSMLKQKYQSFKTFLSTNYHRRSQSFQRIKQRPSTDDPTFSANKED